MYLGADSQGGTAHHGSRATADQAAGSGHSALRLRLMQLVPHVTRGMRRWQDRAAPAPASSPLSPWRVAASEQIRGGLLTVGELASQPDLTLPTVSGCSPALTAQAWSSGALTRPTGGARSSRSPPAGNPDRPLARWRRHTAGPRPGQAHRRRAGSLPQGHGPARNRAAPAGHRQLNRPAGPAVSGA